ncbi:hypothetical protein LguiA_018044 [Lonicera macranthoides]
MESCKILVFGGTGYIGRHIVKASVLYGHPTYVYTRPNSSKTDILQDFQAMGVILIKGELNEHEKLVSVLQEVDAVIAGLAYPQVLEQFKIIEAIKATGNIKRFLPLDFGCDEDRVSVLQPFQKFLNKKKEIRRAVEAAGIPYTFVSANLCAVLNYEEDIGRYTIKVAIDPRTCNRVVIYRPKANIISQFQLISLWEKKTGRTFKRVHLSEQQIIALSESLPDPENIPVAILQSVFVKGDTANFDLGENDIEASTLYPDLQYTTIDQLLEIFLHNPPKPISAAFARHSFEPGTERPFGLFHCAAGGDEREAVGKVEDHARAVHSGSRRCMVGPGGGAGESPNGKEESERE